jgi:hypothetical protein
MAQSLTTRPLSHLIHPFILSTIHQLSELMLFQTFDRRSPNPIWTFNATLQDMNYINLSTFHVIYNLLSLPYQSQITLSRLSLGASWTPTLQEPLRVSLLLFFYANWRMHEPTSPIMRTLSSQLKDSLDAYTSVHCAIFTYTIPHTYSPTTDPYGSAVHGLLIWILCLGAHASAGQRERPWFVLQVAVGSRVLGLRRWEDLRRLVLGFFYSDEVYGESFREIWDESCLLLARV